MTYQHTCPYCPPPPPPPKPKHIINIPDGQYRTFRWTDPASMAASYYTGGTGTISTSTAAFHQMTIHNQAGTTSTVSQLDTDTFLVSTGTSTGILPWYQQQQAQPPPGPSIDPRILNRYLSASDLLEEFIADIGELGITQGGVLSVPIELFINWLVVKAAEEDGAKVDDIPKLPGKKLNVDHCKCCGWWLPKALRGGVTLFYNGEHYDRYLAAHG